MVCSQRAFFDECGSCFHVPRGPFLLLLGEGLDDLLGVDLLIRDEVLEDALLQLVERLVSAVELAHAVTRTLLLNLTQIGKLRVLLEIQRF